MTLNAHVGRGLEQAEPPRPCACHSKAWAFSGLIIRVSATYCHPS